METKVAPDIRQACAEKIFSGLDVAVYLDDYGLCTNKIFEYYLKLVDMCLSTFHTNNLNCNPLIIIKMRMKNFE